MTMILPFITNAVSKLFTNNIFLEKYKYFQGKFSKIKVLSFLSVYMFPPIYIYILLLVHIGLINNMKTNATHLFNP